VLHRFGAPGLFIVKHMTSALDGKRVYPRAISAIERVEEDGRLLLDPSFTIWECDGTPAGTCNSSPVHQAVLNAVDNLASAEFEVLTRLSSHSVTDSHDSKREFNVPQVCGRSAAWWAQNQR
jgi:hypothetical protein